jgi:glycosyltransferase involved in cell wall biosynthesis
MTDFSLAVVIPTRNRAALAIDAIRSLLETDSFAPRIVVSDNSSRADESERLAAFCGEHPDVIYVRSPDSLAMGAHWDWALQQAEERTGCSHFTIHYDRKVTIPRRLARVAAAAARVPEMLVNHLTDAIFTSEKPRMSRLRQAPADGNVYELQSPRVLRRIAEGKAAATVAVLPLLCNCIVPRNVLDKIRGRFGTVCDSTAADVSFSFRFLALYDSYLHCDLSTGVLRAFDRSHAIGFIRGQGGDFHGDFLSIWGGRPWLDAAPIAGLSLGQNMLFHEYGLVQRAVGGERFPPITMNGYLDELASALPAVEDERTRDEMRQVLVQRGWRDTTSARQRLRLVARHIAVGIVARSRAREIRQKLVLLLADRARIRPRHLNAFAFATDDDALRYAIRFPRRGARRPVDWVAALGAAKFGSQP